MKKAIIFDMDGTITMTEQFHIKAFTELFAQAGMFYDPREHISKFAGAGSRFVIKEMFARNGKILTDDEVAHYMSLKRDLYTKIVQQNEIPVVKGVHEFVDKIDGMGYKKIIATGNGDLDAVRYILGRINLADKFPDIISITEVPRGKPFPDVFIRACERLNVAPIEAVVLEDSTNGVKAAKAAKIDCIAFETTTKKEDLLAAGATAVLPDYTFITDNLIS